MMKLLTLRNVRCFETLDLRLDPRITLLIGENGAGKTTIAEALASLCYGEEEGLASFPLRQGAETGSIALVSAGPDGPDALWTAGPEGEHRRLPADRYLFAYGRYRRVRFPEPPPAKPGMPEILGPEWDEARLARPFADLETAVLKRRTTTLTRPDNHLLRDLGGYLVALHERRSWDSRADVTWRRLEASLQDLGQGFERMAVVERRDRRVPVLVRRGMELGLGELSDGYQAFLVVVFDLLLRYLYLFPLLDDPLQGEALVVIDEVDLHLHPRWQRTVVGQLVELFPRTQFVLTAHSPAVVQGAIDEGFRVTVLREKDDRAELTELEPPAPEQLRGAEIGSLWVEEGLFAVPSRYSRRVEAQEEEARRLREKIEAGEATEADRRQLISLLEELELLQADDEKRRSQGPLLSELAKAQIGFLRQLDEMIQGGGKA